MPVASSTLFFAASASALLLGLLQSDEPAGPVVETLQGPVRGAVNSTGTGREYLAFHNVPYAKPPVGQLRFRSPQSPDPWADIRDATIPGPVCPQNRMLGPNESEDCLYLNVYTPELKPLELRSVMVWIHGGGWIGGTGNGYDPGYLIDNDVVVVTINYRVGPLGFLSTDDENCPGNFGLKDQVAALKWVKDNIKAFGGNPSNVTIFGNSAGGASVNYHMLSTASKGLFQKAISESGVALTPWALPEPGLNKARRMAAMVGCRRESTAELVECLRRKSAFTLTALQLLFFESLYCPIATFKPAVEESREGSFLTDNPMNLKPYASLPWLVGVNKEEAAIFTAVLAQNETLLEVLDEKSNEVFPVCLAYETSPQPELITERIHNFYFPYGNLSLSGVTDLFTDGLFTWKTDKSVRSYQDTGPVYYYLFSYRGKYSMSQMFGGGDKDVGVAHGDEIFYLFPNNPHLPITEELPATDIEMGYKLTKLWTDFAKTGNPTPKSDPVHWPQATSHGELEYLDIGEELQAKQGLSQNRVDFWNSLPI